MIILKSILVISEILKYQYKLDYQYSDSKLGLIFDSEDSICKILIRTIKWNPYLLLFRLQSKLCLISYEHDLEELSLRVIFMVLIGCLCLKL